MVIHADENRLTRNIFPFSINVKGVYTLLVPNAVFNRYVAQLDQRGISAAPEERWPPPSRRRWGRSERRLSASTARTMRA